MLYADAALIAYGIDRVVGEFGFIRHPVVVMGDLRGWFEKRFYCDSVVRGVVLVLMVVGLGWGVSYGISVLVSESGDPGLHVLFTGVIASMAIAAKMLHDSVADILIHPAHIRYLVSRDTEGLSESDTNKAAIETYAENLSDGVIAPLLYLVLFGLTGVFVYKAVNTLDSMVGYRNERYEKFGKCAARLDDALNWIPARMTAVMIMLLSPSHVKNRSRDFSPVKKLLGRWGFGLATEVATPGEIFHQAQGHESPNAGYPIAAMAFALGVKLGGPTSYFGRIKEKPFFGHGREAIVREDVERALAMQWRFDAVIIVILGVLVWI